MEVPEDETLLVTPNTSPLMHRLGLDCLGNYGIFTPRGGASSASTRFTSLSSSPGSFSRRASELDEFEQHFINEEHLVTVIRDKSNNPIILINEVEVCETQSKDRDDGPGCELIDGNGKCYPNCDPTVWLRSCEKEVIEPITGETRGDIPHWINGTLLRNGPGSLKVGDMEFKHLFDSSALLHRFCIRNGNVTYQCRLVQSETFKKNSAARRIVVSEFGTAAVPDPCQTIFQKVSSFFKADDFSDNSLISVYPFGDEYYTFAESPAIHKINPDTLATEERVLITDYIGIASHTSHPHVMPDGTVYNLGVTISGTGPNYSIICFPHGERMFKDAYIVGSVPCRWKFHPGYMHSFGVTENFFVIIEQPLSVSLSEWVKNQVTKQALASCLKWFESKCTHFYLMDRKTGTLMHTFKTEAFFYLHVINAYEKSSHVVVDICCYKDPSMLNCMYVESMMNMQSNPNYAKMFRGRPLRFVLPLPKIETKMVKSSTFSSILSRIPPMMSLRRSESESQDIKYSSIAESSSSSSPKINELESMLGKDLVTLEGTTANAYKMPDGSLFIRPELLCEIGCETPRINNEKNLGIEYRYFYAISADVDAENPGTALLKLVKVDTFSKMKRTWSERNCYPSEPIFVPRPNAQAEDDGVILSAMVWGNFEENRVGLLVLCAKTFKELGRCEFKTPGPVPKCLHGWFIKDKASFGQS